MKLIKRWAALLAACCLALCAFSLGVAADGVAVTAPAEVWNGSIAEAFEGGSGTEADPYLIRTGAQLALLAKNVNETVTDYKDVYFKLINDIDLASVQWTAIGVGKSTPFRGHFDGNGKTIFNMMCVPVDPNDASNYINGGLFGRIEEAEIKNVTVSGGSVESTKYAGGVVGFMQGGLVYNCHSKLEKVTGAQVGGVVGRAEKGTDNRIEGCFNWSAVETIDTTNAFAGGIIGAAGNTTIKYCCNYGDVTANAAKTYSTAGGIVGIQGASSATVYIDNCMSSGTITAILGAKNCVGAGGITGKAAHVNFGSITNCFTTGKVVCEDAALAGGVAGVCGSIVETDNLYTTIEPACGTDKDMMFENVTKITDAQMRGKNAASLMGLNRAWSAADGELPAPDVELIEAVEKEEQEKPEPEPTTTSSTTEKPTEPEVTTSTPAATSEVTKESDVTTSEVKEPATSGSTSDNVSDGDTRNNMPLIIILSVLIVLNGAAIAVVAIKVKK